MLYKLLLLILLSYCNLSYAETQLQIGDQIFLNNSLVEILRENDPNFVEHSKKHIIVDMQIFLGGQHCEHIGNQLADQFFAETSILYNDKPTERDRIAEKVYSLFQKFNIGIRRCNYPKQNWLEVSKEDSIQFILNKYRAYED